jgi:hypothetical protein
LLTGKFVLVVTVQSLDSDPSVKQILLQLDSTMHFIIEDLDASHMFIDSSQLETVQRLLEDKLEENVFRPVQ